MHYPDPAPLAAACDTPTKLPKKILQLAAPEFEIEQSTEVSWGGQYLGVGGLRQYMVRVTQHIVQATHALLGVPHKT